VSSQPGVELVEDAVDLYVHSSPDPIPRRFNDIELAHELAAAKLAGAVHRHHSCSTVERAALVREVTGFGMWGAVEVSPMAGGLDPTVVEVGLRQGAPIVALPMLSGSGFRVFRTSVSVDIRDSFDDGDTPVVDGDGSLLPAAVTIMELVRDSGATLIAGYLVASELLAVVGGAFDLGLERVVLSNPIGRGYCLDHVVIEEACSFGPLVVELSVYQLHAFGPRAPGASYVDEAVALIDSLGANRFVLSSDGGAAGAPGPHELLAWGCQALIDRGVDHEDVRRMVTENPAALLS
jgi:hypothetical protein